MKKNMKPKELPSHSEFLKDFLGDQPGYHVELKRIFHDIGELHKKNSVFVHETDNVSEVLLDLKETVTKLLELQSEMAGFLYISMSSTAHQIALYREMLWCKEREEV